jgi:hypothetical protein
VIKVKDNGKVRKVMTKGRRREEIGFGGKRA